MNSLLAALLATTGKRVPEWAWILLAIGWLASFLFMVRREQMRRLWPEPDEADPNVELEEKRAAMRKMHEGISDVDGENSDDEPMPDPPSGVTVWLTGLPSAGKTPLGDAVAEKLKAEGVTASRLDGDELRGTLCRDLGFSKADREENVRRISHVAQELAWAGIVPVVSVIAPYRESRESVRKAHAGRYVEVYVNAPLAACEERDVKGKYKLARSGTLRGLTGVDAPYEAPETPEVECHTDQETVEQSAGKVVDYLKENYSELFPEAKSHDLIPGRSISGSTCIPSPGASTRTQIAFVTTCKGRVEHLAKTLPRNLKDHEGSGATFVVLDYGDDYGLENYIRLEHWNDIQSGRLAYYKYNTTGPFHVSHAKNMAARCGILEGAKILVTLDADNFTGPNFAQFVVDKFREPGITWPGIFLCPDFPLIQSLPHGPERPLRGFAGRLAIWARDFVKAGGYDECYNTWYGEDIDMIARMQRMGYAMRHIENRYLGVIPHNAEVRFKEYPHARQFENKGEVRRINARTETVVNFGKIGLGTVYRNFDLNPIELSPVPTRIFGIGLHKTGTTSLHKAFQILGYDSFHWGTGEAPLIWQEMNALGRSKTLEQWYAFSDLPFPLLYKQLDKAYPGSKFILTVRGPVKWLKSVERLWDARCNPTRWMWDVYPFSNHIHTALYGRKDFNPEVFLKRYWSHLAEVLDYFRGKHDLLIMDMDGGAGWKELCGFLKCPIPDCPYPCENVSGKGDSGCVTHGSET